MPRATLSVAQPYATGKPPVLPTTPVASTQIALVGYSEETKTLALQFKFEAQAVYCYPGVQKATYDAFMAAESKGKFFKENIKPLAFSKYMTPAKAEAAAA